MGFDLGADTLDVVVLQLEFEEALNITMLYLSSSDHYNPTEINTVGKTIEAILRECGDPKAMSLQEAARSFGPLPEDRERTIVRSVWWFNNVKGYGIVRPDSGGADIFLQKTCLLELVSLT